MITITATMPCSDTTRPRMLEGASSGRGFTYDGTSAPCTAASSIAARGTALPSSGTFGRRSAAVAGSLPTFATKQDTTGVRGWSPPV